MPRHFAKRAANSFISPLNFCKYQTWYVFKKRGNKTSFEHVILMVKPPIVKISEAVNGFKDSSNFQVFFLMKSALHRDPINSYIFVDFPTLI